MEGPARRLALCAAALALLLPGCSTGATAQPSPQDEVRPTPAAQTAPPPRLAPAPAATPAPASTPPPTQREAASRPLLRLAQADDDLRFAQRLLNTSSAAKSILASGNEAALAMHAEALAHYEQAVEAQKRGDTEAQALALRKAKMALFKAAQLARTAQGKNVKGEADFERRAKSAEALLEAHQRIREEKAADDEGVKAVETKAREAIDAAWDAYKKGDLSSATQLVDQSLKALKGSLIQLRKGETLVRSLHFETPKEEYEYELDRNESHKLLTSILLKKKPLEPMMQKRFDEAMHKADELRKEAESLAGQEKYEAAIETMEASTQYIVRAIRSAGIYIPG